MACASKQDGVDPTVLLLFVARRVRLFMLVGHCQDLNDKNFQAELLSFQPVEAVDFVEDLDLPLELKMSTGAKVAGVHGPDINAEQSVVSNLMRLHDTWEISVLKNRVVGLDRRLVIAADL